MIIYESRFIANYPECICRITKEQTGIVQEMGQVERKKKSIVIAIWKK
jgi:hypothetical protein